MIAKRSYTYVYRCWKCGTRHRIEQGDTTERMDLKCSRCQRSLLRVNQVPGLVTDSVFMSGRYHDDGFTSDWARKRALAKAKAAGVDTNGAVYCPELCPPGESLSPKAWVKDRADVARRVRELGKGCEGMVNVRAPDVEPEPERPYQAAPDIVEARVKRKLNEIGGDASPKEVAQIRERETHLASGAD